MAVRRPIMNYQDYPPEFQRYNTQYEGAKESIGWMWWDTVTYVSAATVNINLFNAIRATPDLSNMEVAGQLAAPKAFFCRAIRFFAKQQPEATTVAATANTQTGVMDDLAQLINTGVLAFTIGNKLYAQLPLWCLPSGGDIVPFVATGDIDVIVDYASNGLADPRAVFTLSKPLFIAPQINFIVTLSWPAPITLALGNTNITVVLDGDLVRPVQ